MATTKQPKRFWSGALQRFVTIPGYVEAIYEELAEHIYSCVYGVDDGRFHAATVQEIYDWLADGDPEYSSVDELVHDWIEYANQGVPEC